MSSSEDSYLGRVALLQFHVTESKELNLKTALRFIAEAVSKSAKLIVLPEIWNSPYATSAFAEYAEVLPNVGESLESDFDFSYSPSAKFLMDQAKKHRVFLIGGSVPERDISQSEKVYNTCLCINPSGKIVGKHRKLHLFDVDIPGGITFKESDTLSPGDKFTFFNAGKPFGMIGIGICYDIRFPEYALLLSQKFNCSVLVYPGAFNLITGPAHWELLQRSRALDSQCYVLTASPARSKNQSNEGIYPHYIAWGHSTVTVRRSFYQINFKICGLFYS